MRNGDIKKKYLPLKVVLNTLTPFSINRLNYTWSLRSISLYMYVYFPVNTFKSVLGILQ